MDTLLQQISNTNISIERLRAARDQGDQNHKEIEKLLEKKCELEQLEARLREEMKCAAELEQARHTPTPLHGAATHSAATASTTTTATATTTTTDDGDRRSLLTRAIDEDEDR